MRGSGNSTVAVAMPEKQRNGACSRGSRDPEAGADFSENGACCGGSPETGSSCSGLRRNGACSRGCRDPEAEPSCQRKGACSEGCRDPEAVSRRLVAPTQGVATLQAVGVGGPSSGDQRTSVPSDARCGLSATADSGNREVAICILEVRNADGEVLSGSERVGGDREEVVVAGGQEEEVMAGGQEEVVAGCSWADVVRRGTRTDSAVTPPPHSDLAAAAERAGRSLSPRLGWGPVAPLTLRRHADGRHVAFICESEHWEWCCNSCNRNYHSFSSLTQHLRRMHQVTAFIMDCQNCRELYENRRAYNSHMKKCGTAATSGVRPHQCGCCGTQYLRQESLKLHEGCCIQQGATSPQTGPGASSYGCQYCDKPWPNRMSLAQHIRNKHMADSQRDRNREVVVTAPTRQLWTEERRRAFLDIADQVGWSSHSQIASHLGMTVRQVRNYKTKFPRSRWQAPPVISGEPDGSRDGGESTTTEGGEVSVVSSPGSGSGASGDSVSLSLSPVEVPGSYMPLPGSGTCGGSLSLSSADVQMTAGSAPATCTSGTPAAHTSPPEAGTSGAALSLSLSPSQADVSAAGGPTLGSGASDVPLSLSLADVPTTPGSAPETCTADVSAAGGPTLGSGASDVPLSLSLADVPTTPGGAPETCTADVSAAGGPTLGSGASDVPLSLSLADVPTTPGSAPETCTGGAPTARASPPGDGTSGVSLSLSLSPSPADVSPAGRRTPGSGASNVSLSLYLSPADAPTTPGSAPATQSDGPATRSRGRRERRRGGGRRRRRGGRRRTERGGGGETAGRTEAVSIPSSSIRGARDHPCPPQADSGSCRPARGRLGPPPADAGSRPPAALDSRRCARDRLGPSPAAAGSRPPAASGSQSRLNRRAHDCSPPAASGSHRPARDRLGPPPTGVTSRPLVASGSRRRRRRTEQRRRDEPGRRARERPDPPPAAPGSRPRRAQDRRDPPPAASGSQSRLNRRAQNRSPPAASGSHRPARDHLGPPPADVTSRPLAASGSRRRRRRTEPRRRDEPGRRARERPDLPLAASGSQPCCAHDQPDPPPAAPAVLMSDGIHPRPPRALGPRLPRALSHDRATGSPSRLKRSRTR